MRYTGDTAPAGYCFSVLPLDGAPGRVLGAAVARVVAEAVVDLCLGKGPVRLGARGYPAEAAVARRQSFFVI